MQKGITFFILCNIIQQYCDTILGGGDSEEIPKFSLFISDSSE